MRLLGIELRTSDSTQRNPVSKNKMKQNHKKVPQVHVHQAAEAQGALYVTQEAAPIPIPAPRLASLRKVLTSVSNTKMPLLI